GLSTRLAGPWTLFWFMRLSLHLPGSRRLISRSNRRCFPLWRSTLSSLMTYPSIRRDGEGATALQTAVPPAGFHHLRPAKKTLDYALSHTAAQALQPELQRPS